MATNLHSIRSSLKNGNFTPQCNFRSSPPESTEETFKQKWTEITSKCKRELTLIWADEINRRYSTVKLEIQGVLCEIKTHLDQTQFKEIRDSLKSEFQAAAPSSLQKKMRTGFQQKPNLSKPDRRNWQGRRPQNPNRQLNILLNGLTKLIQNKSK